jgi:hypothetical protein
MITTKYRAYSDGWQLGELQSDEAASTRLCASSGGSSL